MMRLKSNNQSFPQEIETIEEAEVFLMKNKKKIRKLIKPVARKMEQNWTLNAKEQKTE